MLRERNPYAYRCHLHNKLTAVYNVYVQYVYIILYMRCIPIYYIHACAHYIMYIRVFVRWYTFNKPEDYNTEETNQRWRCPLYTHAHCAVVLISVGRYLYILTIIYLRVHLVFLTRCMPIVFKKSKYIGRNSFEWVSI